MLKDTRHGIILFFYLKNEKLTLLFLYSFPFNFNFYDCFIFSLYFFLLSLSLCFFFCNADLPVINHVRMTVTTHALNRNLNRIFRTRKKQTTMKMEKKKIKRTIVHSFIHSIFLYANTNRWFYDQKHLYSQILHRFDFGWSICSFMQVPMPECSLFCCCCWCWC